MAFFFHTFYSFHSYHFIHSYSDIVSSTHNTQQSPASSSSSIVEPFPQSSPHQTETIQPTQSDAIKVLITPYVGIWDRNGIIGNWFQPLEHLIYLPPIELPSLPRYSYF